MPIVKAKDQAPARRKEKGQLVSVIDIFNAGARLKKRYPKLLGHLSALQAYHKWSHMPGVDRKHQIGKEDK